MHSNLLLRKPTDSKLYVEDVFSTYLYTGNGSTQTITNGIDLAGKGGLVWIKDRTSSWNHVLVDSARNLSILQSNTTAAQQASGTYGYDVTSLTSSGFTLGPNYLAANVANDAFASWTFRKAPKFFDVVTWSGNSTNRTISHALGTAPGMIIVKRTDTAADWQVYHRSLANTEYVVLNTTAAKAIGATRWNSTTADASTFSLGTDSTVNATGGSYVAYLFAHDTTADGIVQCGSFTGNGTSININLGWEPQFFLVKCSSTAGNWHIVDNMRGFVADGASSTALFANLSNAEAAGSGYPKVSSTGVYVGGSSVANNSGDTYIYLAIRRGPMRTPTDATKVFKPVARTGDSAENQINVGFPVDFWFTKNRGAAEKWVSGNRLAGLGRHLTFSDTTAEVNYGTPSQSASINDGVLYGDSGVSKPPIDNTGALYLDAWFRRAPGFFDVVCYTGTGSARTVSHTLGVAPELIILKGRSAATQWTVSSTLFSNVTSTYIFLNTNDGITTGLTNLFQTPTATTIGIGTGYASNSNWNGSGATYVAYLFASCPGVSKVFSFTGNGSSQNIDCGFTNGARFVLIKRTDAAGSWYVWDSSRGIISANDPYLQLNSTAAEVTTDDSIDPLSTGFTVNQTSSTNVNVNGASYIGIAIS